MTSDERKPIVQVVHSSVILIRLLICSFCWLTNTFVYYGLSLNSVAFAGDKYINFVLVAVVEIPAYCLAWVLTDHIGRKPTLSGSFLLSGAFCLAIQFIPAGKEIKKWRQVPQTRMDPCFVGRVIKSRWIAFTSEKFLREKNFGNIFWNINVNDVHLAVPHIPFIIKLF